MSTGGIQISVLGAANLSKKLNRMPVNIQKAVLPAFRKAAKNLKSESQKICPVLSGDLQGSAYAETTLTAAGVNSEVGYTEPYALRQHEELGYKHLEPGQAKYLETPYKANLPIYQRQIKAAIKAAVEEEKTGGPEE